MKSSPAMNANSKPGEEKETHQKDEEEEEEKENAKGKRHIKEDAALIPPKSRIGRSRNSDRNIRKRLQR